MIYIPATCMVSAASIFSYVGYKSLSDISGGGAMSGKLQPENAAPVLRVTIGWAALYFSFLFYQSWSKFYALAVLKKEAKGSGGKAPSFAEVKYGSAGRKYFTLNADRTVGNMMEQSFVFLAALWTHAVFVDVGSAAQLGWAWLLSRSIYPAAFAGGIPWLFISTVPGYIFIILLFNPVWQLAF
jgi:uncharacterized MAPEG superfamily protein